jgi:uncharacterized membrane protein YgdD (TMEM256/DUF423 family)
MWTIFFAAGSFLSAISVALGAFGAHALKGRLTIEDAAIYETASRYLTTQSLGLLALALLMSRLDHTGLKVGAIALMLGAVIFSGSLYLLVFTGVRSFGAVTPIGGALLITGWMLASWAALSTIWQS